MVSVTVGGDVSVDGKWTYGGTVTFGGNYNGINGGIEFNWTTEGTWGAHIDPSWEETINLRLVKGASN